MNRNGPMSIKMKEKIIETIPLQQAIYVYTPNLVEKIRSPETIDPQNTNSAIPWEQTVYRLSGTRNVITARIIIQSYRMLNNCLDVNRKFSVMGMLMSCETNLLICNRISKHIKESIIKAKRKKYPVKNKLIKKLPMINEIDILAYQYLTAIKQVIQNVVEIYNVFENTNFDGPRFDKVVDCEKEKGIDYKWSYEKLSKFSEFVSEIVQLRNAIEHPNNNRYLYVTNYALSKEGMINPPIMFYCKDGNEKKMDLSSWMEANILKSLQLVECMIIVCAIKALPNIFDLCVKSIPEEEQDKECPIKYEIVLK